MQELIQQFQTIMYVSETVPVSCAMTYEIDMLFSIVSFSWHLQSTMCLRNFQLRTCTGKTNNQLIAAFNALARRIMMHQLVNNRHIIVYYRVITLTKRTYSLSLPISRMYNF